MTHLDEAIETTIKAEVPELPPWANIVPRDGDMEIARIYALEEQARPMPPEAWAIRNLITRFEICHFKIERHLDRIIDAIASMHLDLDPTVIGRAHPRFGEHAWTRDRTEVWLVASLAKTIKEQATLPDEIPTDPSDAS